MSKVLVSGWPKLATKSQLLKFYCPGCHYPVLHRAISEAIDELGIAGNAICVAGVGCCAVSHNTLDIDGISGAHGRAPDIATGIKHSLHSRPMVLTIQGDGDTIAIGASSLINAAARAERITVFMVNNGVFGTTGGQMAPTTLMHQNTTTTPGGRMPWHGLPIHVAELVAQVRGTAYSARGAFTTPANYQRTKKYVKTALQKQIDDVGFSFVEVLSACPPNWHLSPLEAQKRIDEVVIKEFPLGEFKSVDRLE